jgi:hypothetical protein
MRFLVVCSAPRLAALVIFCENRCIGARVKGGRHRYLSVIKLSASGLRVLCVSVVNAVGVLGFMGVVLWGGGLEKGGLGGLPFYDFERHLALPARGIRR